MKIKFLRNVNADQKYEHQLCNGDVCDCSEVRTENATFFKGDIEDPNELNREIDLSSLVYNVDYEIVQYP